MCDKMSENKGFTLIEILVVVALIIITVGVSGDIIVTLVRGYNKAKIVNEIETNANFVMMKLEKELRNGTHVEDVNGGSVGTCGRSIDFVKLEPDDSTSEIEYIIQANGSITRQSIQPAGNTYTLTNADPVTGVMADLSAPSQFCWISTNPDVVSINLVLRQTDVSGNAIFTGDVELNSTIVVRGTY